MSNELELSTQVPKDAKFLYTDFTRDADKYLKELESKITVIQKICDDFLESKPKKKKLTRIDLDLIDGIRELRISYLPISRGYVKEHIKTSVFYKAAYMDINDIKSDKLKRKILHFRQLEREKQEDLISEAFG